MYRTERSAVIDVVPFVSSKVLLVSLAVLTRVFFDSFLPVCRFVVGFLTLAAGGRSVFAVLFPRRNWRASSPRLEKEFLSFLRVILRHHYTLLLL